MENTHRRLTYLLNVYSESSCSRQELEELFTYIRLAQKDERFDAYLRGEWEKAGIEKQLPAEPDWDRLFYSITGSPLRSAWKERTLWKQIAAAAAILVLLGTGGYFLFRSHPQEQLAGFYTNDITPGGNKAVLTLADGSRILLDSAENGILASQGNTAIEKLHDGQLAYKMEGEGPESTAFNTISTPRGGQYQVTLPDGSKVWLNAESSLKFPASFTGGQRKVELSGEAYFEVAKNAEMPFLVSSGGQTVQVLGTKFNISAYRDEAGITTTLLEGSVEITQLGSGQTRLLKPAQEAKVITGKDIQVADTGPEQAVAWKNGKFMFDGDNIESIMRKIARWYNVEVVYQGSMEDKDFAGSISRFANVSDVLRKLELTGTIRFKIEGRRITVMQ